MTHPRIRLGVLVILPALVVLLGNPVRGQSTRPAAIEADVRALLDKLASDDWAERHAAQARLAALAEAAEPTLRAASRDSEDAEVAARCDAALAQICENRLIGATPITFRAAGVAPQAAFATVARQAKIALEPKDPNLWDRDFAPLSLDLDHRPFWEAVRELRTQCGLDLEPAGTRLVIVAVPPAQLSQQTSVSGPFRVRPARIARSAAIEFATGAAGNGTSEFTITLTVQAEPKLNVTRGSRIARLTVAEDENGISLLPPAEEAPPTIVNRTTTADTVRPGISWWPATARLDYPADGTSRQLARLRGTTSATLLVHAETIEVPDALSVKNLVKEVAGAPVVIKSCQRAGSQYEVKVAGLRTLAGLDAMRLFRGQAMEGARLLTSDGRELLLQGTRSSTTADGVELTLRYAAANLPADTVVKLIWQVAIDVRNVDIPFEFTSLPLP
jgi:hypothetical protein